MAITRRQVLAFSQCFSIPLFTTSTPWNYQPIPWNSEHIIDIACVSRRFILPANRLFGQYVVHSDKKENINAPHYMPYHVDQWYVNKWCIDFLYPTDTAWSPMVANIGVCSATRHSLNHVRHVTVVITRWNRTSEKRLRWSKWGWKRLMECISHFVQRSMC